MPSIVFDAYGTLFDLDALVIPATTLLGDEDVAEKMCRIWREKHLEYAWTSVLMNRYQDFDRLSALALDFALSSTPRPANSAVKTQLLDAQKRLALYDDVVPALNRHGSTMKLAVLSNGTFRSLQSLTDTAGILFSFDYVLSVDPLRTYKPAKETYQLALDTLAEERNQIFFVSSNPWDVAGAKSFGFRTIWCNRKDFSFVSPGPGPDMVIQTLAELNELC